MEDYFTQVLDINEPIKNITIKQGDNQSRRLHYQFLDRSLDTSQGENTPLDLTGASAQLFVVLNGANKVAYIAGDVLNPVNGEVSFLIPGSVTQAEGTREAEIRFLDTEGAILNSKTFKIIVEKSIYNPSAIEGTEAYSALDERLRTVDGLERRVSVTESRIDEFSHLEEGSTTGDAELADARVGENGTTYENVGDAIRGQIGDVYDELYADRSRTTNNPAVMTQLTATGISELSDIVDMPDNSFFIDNGASVIQPLLGEDFPGTLRSVTYKVRKETLTSTSAIYTVENLTGEEIWRGWTYLGHTTPAWGDRGWNQITSIASELETTSRCLTVAEVNALSSINTMPLGTYFSASGARLKQLDANLPTVISDNITYFVISHKGTGGAGSLPYGIWQIIRLSGSQRFYGMNTFTNPTIVWSTEGTVVDAGEAIYVAFGASTTVGAVHHFTGQPITYSPYKFPNLVGQKLGLEVHNLAAGSTGLVSRYGSANNYMDLIYGNDTMLSSARLITITVGYGNDATSHVPIGEFDDYYPYDVEGYHPAWSSSNSGVADMIANGATLMGCLNWCIRWISTHYPQAQLIVIFGAMNQNNDRAISIVNSGTESSPVYKLSFSEPYNTSSGYGLANVEMKKLFAKLNIPFINLFEELPWSWYSTEAKDENGYILMSTTGAQADPSTWVKNIHPSDEGYLAFARYIAGRVGALFNR